MFSSSENIKSLTLLTTEKELSTIKTILNFLKDKYPEFKVIKFKTGEIGENILVSFKVKREFFAKVLEKLAYNDIPIIMKDKESREFVDEKKEQKRRKLKAEGWSEITVKKNKFTLQELEILAQQGKLKEIAKEAKGGMRSDHEIIKKAKSLLTLTIENAIENLINYALEKPGLRPDAIDELTLIASDKDLKLFNKQDEIVKAGVAAIELSVTHRNYYDKIIKIANHTQLSNILNVKAAIALSNLFSCNDEDDTGKLPDAVKYLNTRWLKIAMETVQTKFTQEENDKFESFIRFIEERRQAA